MPETKVKLWYKTDENGVQRALPLADCKRYNAMVDEYDKKVASGGIKLIGGSTQEFLERLRS